MLPDSPASIRAHNTALLLDLIWGAGELSRAELSRRSGLSRTTVSSIVNPLVEAEVLHVGFIGQSRGGRPPEVLRFSTRRFHLLGVELGAAHLSVLLVDLEGQPKARRAKELPVESDPAGALATLHRFVDEVLAEGGVAPASVLGMGVAVPCPVLPDRPDELSVQILPRWRQVRLHTLLTQRHGWPVFIDNDANMGALGEQRWGAGRGQATFAWLKVATGVGAGLVIDGRLYRGPGGIAGEIGHTAIDARGPRCRCGLNGCLETFVGTRSLERAAAERLAACPDPGLGPAPDIAALVAAALDGHPLANALIAEAGVHLGVAIANLVNLVNPTRVILGGRLTRAGDRLLHPLQMALRQRAMWSSVLETEVMVSGLGDDAIALGAATSVLQAALRDPQTYFLHAEPAPAAGPYPTTQSPPGASP